MKSIKTGPKVTKGSEFASQATARSVDKQLKDNRDKLRETHRNQFSSDEEFNSWADYLELYKISNGKDITFPATIQSEGLGSTVLKGGGSGLSRALPSIFRRLPNFEGPALVTGPGSTYNTRVTASPQIFQDLTPEQVRQYAFGPAHNGAEFKDGEGTLADYIQAGGNPANPQIRPFLDLFRAETTRQEQGTLQDIMNRSARDAAQVPLPPEEDIPEVPLNEPVYPNNQQVASVPRTRIWTDMWKNTKNKPKGGSAKNGKWRKEMDATLEGETIPDVNSPEYPAFLEKLRNKFYKTPAGSTMAPIAPAPPNGQMAPVQPGNVPITDPNLNLPPIQQPTNPPIGIQPVRPPLRLQPTQPNQVARRPPNGPPEPSRGPGGRVERGRPPANFTTRRMVPPLIPPLGGPDKPKLPKDKIPKDKFPPDEKKPEDKPTIDDTTVATDDHKMLAGTGYGYLRPEFSTDTGAESLVLTGKEQLHALNQWDKFDEVTDAIYTLDNPLYVQQLNQDKERFSGIAKDPFFYVGEEYAKHNAPDEFKIFPNQGSMFNANNKMTALGQVRRDAFNIVGPRDRGLVVREDPDYEMSMLESMYQEPDLEAQIEHKMTYDDNYDDVMAVGEAMRKTEKTMMMNRWTTETSGYNGPSDTSINQAILKMELKM